MQELGWRRRWGSCPAARRGARQRAGLTPASASNTLSCLLEMLHSKQLRSIKILVDSNHGIYRNSWPLSRWAQSNVPSRRRIIRGGSAAYDDCIFKGARQGDHRHRLNLNS